MAGHGLRLYDTSQILWFLTALFFCVVVCALCRRIAGGHPGVYGVAVLLSLMLPDGFGLVYDKFMLPYFVAGLLFWRYSSRITLALYRISWCIAAVVFIVLLQYWNSNYYIYTSGMSLAVAEPLSKLFIIWYRFMAGFAGIITAVASVHLLQSRVRLLPFIWIGRYTMGIYILSVFANPLLGRLGVPHTNVLEFNLVITPVLACLVCALTALATRVIQMSKPASTLLLGA
jgi:hypothetical protein